MAPHMAPLRSARGRPPPGAAMLLLPRLDDLGPARGERSPFSCSPHGTTVPLKSVFHLCGKDGADMADLQSMQQRRLVRIHEASRQVGDEPSGRDAPPPQKGLRTPRRDSGTRPMEPLCSTRSTQRYNGVEGISLSQAGSWLDCRCFRETCEQAGASPKSINSGLVSRPTARKPGSYSEGEMFVLKRCKDTLLRRFGTLPNAFKRLDQNKSTSLAMIEFLGATSGLLKATDAKILYRLLDVDGDEVVTLSEMQKVMEDI